MSYLTCYKNCSFLIWLYPKTIMPSIKLNTFSIQVIAMYIDRQYVTLTCESNIYNKNIYILILLYSVRQSFVILIHKNIYLYVYSVFFLVNNLLFKKTINILHDYEAFQVKRKIITMTLTKIPVYTSRKINSQKFLNY